MSKIRGKRGKEVGLCKKSLNFQRSRGMVRKPQYCCALEDRRYVIKTDRDHYFEIAHVLERARKQARMKCGYRFALGES